MAQRGHRRVRHRDRAEVPGLDLRLQVEPGGAVQVRPGPASGDQAAPAGPPPRRRPSARARPGGSRPRRRGGPRGRGCAAPAGACRRAAPTRSAAARTRRGAPGGEVAGHRRAGRVERGAQRRVGRQRVVVRPAAAPGSRRQAPGGHGLEPLGAGRAGYRRHFPGGDGWNRQRRVGYGPIMAQPGAERTASPPLRVAAIDCGTNSIRLLIADLRRTASGAVTLEDVHREMRVVRLGEGVDATGRLSTQALDRTWRALVDYAAAIRTSGAVKLRMAATSATRDAENRDDFTDDGAAHPRPGPRGDHRDGGGRADLRRRRRRARPGDRPVPGGRHRRRVDRTGRRPAAGPADRGPIMRRGQPGHRLRADHRADPASRPADRRPSAPPPPTGSGRSWSRR